MFGRQTSFLKEIDALLEKGFSHEQITAMFTTPDAPPTQAAGTVSGDDTNPLVDSPETNAENSDLNSDPVREDKPDTNNEILNAINELRKSVQANNIHTMSVESVDSEAALESAMAELIRPSFDTKGE